MNNTVIRDIPEQLTEKDLGSEERDMGCSGTLSDYYVTYHVA